MHCAKAVVRAGAAVVRRGWRVHDLRIGCATNGVRRGHGRAASLVVLLGTTTMLVACMSAPRPAWEYAAIGGKPGTFPPPPPRPATGVPATAAPVRPGPADHERTAVSARKPAVAAKPLSPPLAAVSGKPVQLAVQTDGAAVAGDTAGSAPGVVGISASANGMRTAPPPPELVYAGTETHIARHEDTLIDIAIEENLGFIELAKANPGVDPWLPGEGTPIVLPKLHLPPDAPPRGIVLNIPEQRLYYYVNGKLMRSFPIGIGRDGHSTPLGSTRVVRKQANPTWYPTPSSRADDPTLPAAMPTGPDNPLGTRALYLGWSSYLIHGTNKGYGIGRRASRGCIRMYNTDVEWLYSRVPVGTPVTAVDQPIKLGFLGDELYLEAAPSIRQVQQWEADGRFEAEVPPDLKQRITARAGTAADRIDWTAVDRAVAERRGIPVRITQPVATAVAAVEEESFDLVKWLRRRLAIGTP